MPHPPVLRGDCVVLTSAGQTCAQQDTSGAIGQGSGVEQSVPGCRKSVSGPHIGTCDGAPIPGHTVTIPQATCGLCAGSLTQGPPDRSTPPRYRCGNSLLLHPDSAGGTIADGVRRMFAGLTLSWGTSGFERDLCCCAAVLSRAAPRGDLHRRSTTSTPEGGDVMKKIQVRKPGSVRLTARANYCYGCCCCAIRAV